MFNMYSIHKWQEDTLVYCKCCTKWENGKKTKKKINYFQLSCNVTSSVIGDAWRNTLYVVWFRNYKKTTDMNVEATLNVNNERVSLTLINKTKQKY